MELDHSNSAWSGPNISFLYNSDIMSASVIMEVATTTAITQMDNDGHTCGGLKMMSRNLISQHLYNSGL